MRSLPFLGRLPYTASPFLPLHGADGILSLTHVLLLFARDEIDSSFDPPRLKSGEGLELFHDWVFTRALLPSHPCRFPLPLRCLHSTDLAP